MEGKVKELEMKVMELKREYEGLRREIGRPRGLVVSVTGAAQGSNTTHTSRKNEIIAIAPIRC